MADYLALFATAILFGGMASFSAVFAPLVFIKLPGETAGAFIRQVFPWYYLFVIVVAAFAALGLAFGDLLGAGLMAAAAAGGVFARAVLMPAINRARDRELAGEAAIGRRFQILHQSSVVINFVQMVLAAVVLARFLG